MAGTRIKITQSSGNYIEDDVFTADPQVAQDLVNQSLAEETEDALNVEDTPAACYWNRQDQKKGWPNWG